MGRSLRLLAVIAALSAWHAATPSWAEDPLFGGLDVGRLCSEGTWQDETALGLLADRGRFAEPIGAPLASEVSNRGADAGNAAAQQDSPRRPEPPRVPGGAVCGRLLNKGRPLVNCRVTIVPMHKENGVFCFDPDRQMLSEATDNEGAYRFENVSAGEYKLTWLPDGQTRWIRRIAMRPDVTVRAGETTTAKDIRIALQTIN